MFLKMIKAGDIDYTDISTENIEKKIIYLITGKKQNIIISALIKMEN